MTRVRVFEWQNQFPEGREEMEDDEYVGRSVTARTDREVQKINNISLKRLKTETVSVFKAVITNKDISLGMLICITKPYIS